MPDEPTLGELLRRLDDVTKANERTVNRLDELTRTLEDRYIPRREYEQRISDVEQDIKDQAAFRRQVAAGALVGLLLLVANVLVTLSRTIPGAGA